MSGMISSTALWPDIPGEHGLAEAAAVGEEAGAGGLGAVAMRRRTTANDCGRHLHSMFSVRRPCAAIGTWA